MTYAVLFLAVFLGGLSSFLIKAESNAFKMVLAFSGAFLFGTLMMHLLPEVFSQPSAGWWVLIGFGLQLVLDFVSKGLEHGHYHSTDKLLPVLPLLGLFLHAFVEGMPFGVEHPHVEGIHDHYHNGLLWSIGLHKFPIALLVASALRKADIKPWLVILGITLFALSSPLGSLLSHQWLPSTAYSIPILGLTSGLLLHVSTTILFESSANHQFNAVKIFFVALGMVLSIVLL